MSRSSSYRPAHRAQSRVSAIASAYGLQALGCIIAAGLVATVAFIGIATIGIASPLTNTMRRTTTHATHVIPATPVSHLVITASTSLAHPFAGGPHTVRRGESLSSIAQATYSRGASCWPGVFRANRITHHPLMGANPNVITAGQRLDLPRGCDATPLPKPKPVYHAPAVHLAAASLSDGDSSHGSSIAGDSSPARTHSTPSSSGSSGGYSVSSSFQACVIKAESGGNPNIWNASAHWGLYQFSASTWALHGGDPALFGHASAAYQTQIFWNTVHADGTSDWAPYDGC